MSLKLRGIFLIIFSLVSVGLLVNGSYVIAADEGSKNKVIKIGWMAWPENEALMGTAKVVLEEKMGYKVKPIFLDVGVAMESLAAGEIDVMFELCVPSYHGKYWDKIANKVFIAGNSYTFAEGALYVPNYVPKEEVKSIRDLKELEARKKFGAKIIGIDPGSGQNQMTENTIKAYDLDYKLIAGSEAANLATLKKAVAKRKWIVTSLWTPHHIWGSVDARPLEDPLGTMGFPDFCANAIRKDIMKDFPREVGRFLARFHLPLAEIHKIMSWMAKEKLKPTEAGKRYVMENPNRVHYWITGEIKE